MKSIALTSAAFLAASVLSVQAETWNACYVSGGVSLAKGSAAVSDMPFQAGPLAGTGTTWGGMESTFDVNSGTEVGVRAGVGCDRTMSKGGKSYVLGVIADVATWLSNGSGANPASIDSQFSYQTDGVATLRGRAGLVKDKNLFYVTGGLALAKTGTRAFDTATAPGLGTMDVSGSDLNLGWVLGAGVEWQVKPNMTMRVEFLHHRFDGANATGQATFPTVAFPNFDSDMRENTLSIGFNWRL